MNRQGDKETRGQGDRGRARAPSVPVSPCRLVPLSLRRHRRAFTLAEVLATLVLVGVVLPAVMKGISLALAASDDARRRVEAVGLAENKLAEMTADTTTGQTSTTGGTGGGEYGEEAPGFRWEASSTSVDTNLTELHVRVAWTARGRERWVDLSSYAYVTSTSSGTAGTGTTGGGAP